MMLKLDCKSGLLSRLDEDATLVNKDNVLSVINEHIEFDNAASFTLRTIKLLLINYPDLLKLSNWGDEFLRLSVAAKPRIGLIANPGNDQITHLVLQKTTDVIRTELYSVQEQVNLWGVTPQGDVSLGLLNLKDLLYLPIEIRNAEIIDRQPNPNMLCEKQPKNIATVFTQGTVEISLDQLLFSVYMDIDLFDPEDNDEVTELLTELFEQTGTPISDSDEPSKD